MYSFSKPNLPWDSRKTVVYVSSVIIKCDHKLDRESIFYLGKLPAYHRYPSLASRSNIFWLLDSYDKTITYETIISLCIGWSVGLEFSQLGCWGDPTSNVLLLLSSSSRNVCLESLGPRPKHGPGALGDSQFLAW